MGPEGVTRWPSWPSGETLSGDPLKGSPDGQPFALQDLLELIKTLIGSPKFTSSRGKFRVQHQF